MSVVNVKFSYAGQPASEVHQIYRTATTASTSEHIPLTKPEVLPVTPAPPVIEELILNSGNIAVTPVVPVVPTVEEVTQPKPAQITTVKSEEVLPSAPKAQEKRSESPKPILKIEQVNENEFTKIVAPKKEKQETKQPTDLVLKAPSFKFTPKQEGDISRVTTKEYVRPQNAERYLYSGIPEKSEDDFVGCFGCMRKKPKAYSIEKKSK